MRWHLKPQAIAALAVNRQQGEREKKRKGKPLIQLLCLHLHGTRSTRGVTQTTSTSTSNKHKDVRKKIEEKNKQM